MKKTLLAVSVLSAVCLQQAYCANTPKEELLGDLFQITTSGNDLHPNTYRYRLYLDNRNPNTHVAEYVFDHQYFCAKVSANKSYPHSGFKLCNNAAASDGCSSDPITVVPFRYDSCDNVDTAAGTMEPPPPPPQLTENLVLLTGANTDPCGSGVDRPLLYTSKDSGVYDGNSTHWDQSQIDSSNSYFSHLACKDKTHCFSDSGTSLYFTSNGGDSWSDTSSTPSHYGKLTCTLDGTFCVGVGQDNTSTNIQIGYTTSFSASAWNDVNFGGSIPGDLRDVTCSNDTSFCVAVGYDSTNMMIYYSNTPKTGAWLPATISGPHLGNLYSVYCNQSGNLCLAAGDDGSGAPKLYVSTNHMTWNSVTISPSQQGELVSVTCTASGSYCAAVGNDSLSPRTAILLESSAPANINSWTLATLSNLPSPSRFDEIACSADNTFCITGRNSPSSGDVAIYTWSSGSHTWNQINFGAIAGLDPDKFTVNRYRCSINTLKPKSCMLVGKFHTGGMMNSDPAILTTSDGGVNWNFTRFTLPNIYKRGDIVDITNVP